MAQSDDTSEMPGKGEPHDDQYEISHHENRPAVPQIVGGHMDCDMHQFNQAVYPGEHNHRNARIVCGIGHSTGLSV